MKYLICALLLLGGGRAWACDACGCSLNTLSLNGFQQLSRNYVAIQYGLQNLRTAPESELASLAGTYQTVQLAGRISLSQRWSVTGLLPYVYDRQQNGLSRGIGDARLLGSYRLIDRSSCNGSEALILTAGAKLPTGRYSDAAYSGVAAAQPGSGAIDAVTDVLYSRTINKWVLAANAGYIFTGVNRAGVKFGNGLTTSANCYRTISAGSAQIRPFVSAAYEYTLQTYDNYEKRWLDHSSGGYQAFAGGGVQAVAGKMSFQIGGQLAVAQHYFGGKIRTPGRCEAGAFYNF